MGPTVVNNNRPRASARARPAPSCARIPHVLPVYVYAYMCMYCGIYACTYMNMHIHEYACIPNVYI